jgi:Tol biopolymer transport system component
MKRANSNLAGAVAALALVVVGWLPRPAPALAAFPGANGLIAFTRGGILVVNPDGSNEVRLTQRGGGPAWSPDGTKIAFGRNGRIFARGGIRIMNADGTGVMRLTKHGLDSSPTWSPDATRIAFQRYTNDAGWQIFSINTDGTGLRRLTRTLGYGNEGPAWSPDGTKIAFVTIKAEIFVMDANGRHVMQLTDPPAGSGDADPNWSPDGSRLTFARCTALLIAR